MRGDTRLQILILLLAFTSVFAYNVTDALTAEGYPWKVYYPVTPDGFVLTVVRITGGLSKAGKAPGPKPVVFLQHGLLDDCATWIVNSPQQSLGFLLADAGYDVFMGNVRGNSYSTRNLNYTEDDSTYWRHIDFDYMISQDLPTMIGEALRVTGRKTLSYVGHSQGTLIGFGAFSTNFELAKKINVFVALAPVAYVGNTGVPLLKFLSAVEATDILTILGERSFLMPGWLITLLGGTVCKYTPAICGGVLGIFTGYDSSNLNLTRLSYTLTLEPGGTSVQNMAHWSQIVRSGGLQFFDFKDTQENIRHYNAPTPPNYPLHQLSKKNGVPPMAFFTGTRDPLADPTDVKMLAEVIPDDNKPMFWLNEPSYQHLDFIWGENAHELIYPDVMKIIAKYKSTD